MYREGSPSYIRNENDQPDFGSVLLTIDSQLIATTAESDDVIQKVVLSTQSPAASLIGLFNYYGEPGVIASPATMNMMMEAGRAGDPIFVYLTPREGQVEVLMRSDTWEALVDHPAFGSGSLLLMTERLSDVVARAVADFQAHAGGVPKLFFMDAMPAPRTPPLEDPNFVADPVPTPGDAGPLDPNDPGPGTSNED